MTTHLVLTIIADDKPGLVETLAQTIAAHGGNWLESSMAQLAGKFAGILRISVADTEADALIQQLENLPDELNIVVGRATDSAMGDAAHQVDLSLVGNDRPGIVREISHVLASVAVNVEELHTECVPAPMSGDSLFKAKARLHLPSGLAVDQLQKALEELADDLIVEIQLD